MTSYGSLKKRNEMWDGGGKIGRYAGLMEHFGWDGRIADPYLGPSVLAIEQGCIWLYMELVYLLAQMRRPGKRNK